ncbi:MAG: hypothetical protein GYB26_02375 [Gammaproteobacteria bacterium]|uniref:Uncharacterized protein n=1 Tax=Marinobacter litoralis TaxID=187981 RepID=A0A3M2RBT5_9GAMM|nr:hypothetical protein [Marinobacter litoralis]MBR9869968.1 hypothetical protein [Gammaproteobacteria bacterium]RMJ02594.1 hypothetical protein DOQ08_02057 [Marinobacter litoralis]
MFQLVFKGECTSGTDVQTARANAKALFKASVEQLDRMFSGQAVVIRNKLDQEQAEKYQAVLKKHGMVVHVQPMAVAGRPASAPSGQVAAANKAESAGSAPQGKAPAPKTKSGKAPDVEPGDRLPVAGEKVDDILAGSDLSLDPVGVTLVEHQEVEAPMFEHLDEWSIAPPGSDLGVKRETPPPIVPDTSHISLADDDKSS